MLAVAAQLGTQLTHPDVTDGGCKTRTRRAISADRRSLRADRPVGAGTRRWKTMGVPDRWPNYSKVRFRSDQHRANGAPEGSVGYIVEVEVEVEVTEPETGETLFLGAVPDADLDLISGHGPVS